MLSDEAGESALGIVVRDVDGFGLGTASVEGLFCEKDGPPKRDEDDVVVVIVLLVAVEDSI